MGNNQLLYLTGPFINPWRPGLPVEPFHFHIFGNTKDGISALSAQNPFKVHWVTPVTVLVNSPHFEIGFDLSSQGLWVSLGWFEYPFPGLQRGNLIRTGYWMPHAPL